MTLTLAWVKTSECPFCGDHRISKEVSESQHCNGAWNQSREFTCGYKVAWSPNFSRLEVKQGCRRSEEHAKGQAEAQRLELSFIRSVNKSKLTATQKRRALNSISYMF